MRPIDKNDAEIADLVLQLSRAAYIDCSAGGLTQAQWIAIRFFSRANRFSRTISGYAQFHATTRGTASQTVKSLVAKGYLVRTPSEKDARSADFELTAMARNALKNDPLDAVTAVAGNLSSADQAHVTAALRAMLEQMREDRRHSSVGVCKLCGYRDGGKRGQDACCRLMQEPLADTEFEELCVRFRPISSARA